MLNDSGRDAVALGFLLYHVLAHAWHTKPELFAGVPTITAPHEQLVYAVAAEGAWPALDQIPARERLVAAVALSWFCAADRASAAWCCAQRARRLARYPSVRRSGVVWAGCHVAGEHVRLSHGGRDAAPATVQFAEPGLSKTRAKGKVPNNR